MEQLIFESDKKEMANKGPYPTKVLYESGFEAACSYKNNQMFEFDKWKAEKDWHWHKYSETYEMMGHHEWQKLSFSELFEIFEKETSR